jgi:aconitate hydratase 2/2-methylisocitrate dehydratase
MGRITTREEYMADVGVININGAEIYRYMNFDQIEEYRHVSVTVVD